MEDIYRNLIKNITLQYLDASLDSDIYNIENLVSRVLENYFEDYPLQDFIEEVEEQIAEVLEQKFKILVNY